MTRQQSRGIDANVRRDFQRDLKSIIEEFVQTNGIEIFGDLNIEVVNIDNLALIKGNTIYVNPSARELPEHVLKYVVAHELAHLIMKRHTKRFWEIVRHIYPQYEKGKSELSEIFINSKSIR